MSEILYPLTEQFMGWMLLLVGASVLIRPMVWVSFGQRVYNMDKADIDRLSIITTLCFLPMGILIVLTHNDWSLSSASSLIVTILGWTIIVKTLLFSFLPTIMMKTQEFIFKNKSENFLKWFFRTIGLIYIGVSILILCNYLCNNTY